MDTTRAPHDLPARLELPLRSGREHWYWTGGRPAVDLVNTLRERWWRQVETLCSPDDLDEWLRRAGLLAAGGGGSDAALLADAHELREAIDAALVAVTGGGPVETAQLEPISRWAALAPAARLVASPAGVPVRDGGTAHASRTALAAVAEDAVRMLGTDERSRLRICGADDCSARFFDRSPAGRRRWCSMAGCGTRAKVRAHRARRAEPTQGAR
ncbi:MAG: ABATE domain-containing protein [Thermoleophilia bacterium]